MLASDLLARVRLPRCAVRQLVVGPLTTINLFEHDRGIQNEPYVYA